MTDKSEQESEQANRCKGELRLPRFKTPPVLIHW